MYFSEINIYLWLKRYCKVAIILYCIYICTVKHFKFYFMVQGNFYRLKTDWIKELADGSLSKVKTEELILAESYSEVEKMAYAIAEDQQRTQHGPISYEIVKTKISDILYNDVLVSENTIEGKVENYFEQSDDNGAGLYSVKVVTFILDEKGNEKKQTDTYYVPAFSNNDAYQAICDYMVGSTSDYVIRDIKFDKAEAIFWDEETHKSKKNEFAGI